MIKEYEIENKEISLVEESGKNKYGSIYSKIVADFMVSLADITSDSKILEPSSGQGVFLIYFTIKDIKTSLHTRLIQSLMATNITLLGTRVLYPQK